MQQNPAPPDEPQPESRMLQEILNRYREPEQTSRRPKITREINELNRIRAPLTSRRKKWKGSETELSAKWDWNKKLNNIQKVLLFDKKKSKWLQKNN